MARKRGITDEHIIEMYVSGMSYVEMSSIIGITNRAIRNVLVKHGIERKPIGRPRIYQVNEHFFKTWTHEMAWVLGLFITDGNVQKDLHSISLAQKDETILRKVAAVMGAHPVIRDPIGTRKTPLLIINSKIIKEDLKQLGITSNKSYTVPFPDVPEQYLPAFIRGVIDGDGWVDRQGYSLNITTASFKFAMGIMKTIECWNINPFLQTTKSTSSQKNIYRVWVKGKQQVLTLAQIIYLNSDSNHIAYKKSRMFFHSDPNNLKLLGKFQTAQGRIRFRTTISIERLEPVKQLAIKQNVPINRLLERCINQLLNTKENITICKTDRPKDRIHFKTTYQKSLLEELRVLAKSRGLYINDLIEYSLKFLGDRGK